MSPARRTDPATGETRTWNGSAWVPEAAPPTSPPPGPTPAAGPSIAEALGRGTLQGATAGFSDEIAGAINAAATKDPSWLGGILATSPLGSAIYSMIKKDRPEILADYRQGRDESRAANQAAQKAHPYAYTSGQVAGGLASAALPGGGATTLGRAVLGGFAYGTAAGLGESRADLTKGELGAAAADAAVGGAVGTAGGLLGYGAVKGAGALWRKATSRAVPVAEKAAEDTASNIAKNPGALEAAGHSQPVKSFYERSMQLQKEVSQDLGEPFRLRPSQALGNREAALAESKAAQWPGTMNAAQAGEAQQMKQSGRWLDMLTDRVAAKPEMLGKAEVSDQIVSSVERHMESMIKARSAAARPLYEAAEQSGSKVPLAPIKKAIQQQIDDNRLAPDTLTSQLKQILGKIEGSEAHAGHGGGGKLVLDLVDGNWASGSYAQPALPAATMAIRDVQDLRSFLTNVTRGKATIVENMPIANQARIAREVLDSVDQALEESAAAGGQGAAALQKANATWRQYSQAIDETATETVRKLLKLGATDSGDTATEKLLSGSPEQIRGVFKLLNKADPGTAMQARAQLLDQIFTKAGKAPRGASYAAELGVNELHPKTAIKLLKDNEPKLRAAFEGDPKAMGALRKSMELLQRLSFGPNLKGSQTAPLVAEAVAEAGAKHAAGAAAGPVGFAAAGVFSKMLGSGKALAKAYTTPEGIDVFNQVLQAQLAARNGKPISAAALASIDARASALGLLDFLRAGESASAPQFAQAEVPQ